MSKALPRRNALINRNTNETKIQVSLSLDGGPLDPLPDDASFSADSVAPNAPIPSQTTSHHASQLAGSQQIWIWTGVGFLDHMLHAWSKHAGWSLRVRCRGDLASISLPPPNPYWALQLMLSTYSRRPPHNRRHLPRPRHRLQNRLGCPHRSRSLRPLLRPARRSAFPRRCRYFLSPLLCWQFRLRRTNDGAAE